jgi:hypothetical protein
VEVERRRKTEVKSHNQANLEQTQPQAAGGPADALFQRAAMTADAAVDEVLGGEQVQVTVVRLQLQVLPKSMVDTVADAGVWLGSEVKHEVYTCVHDGSGSAAACE